jgi:hypothetical protein
LISLVLDRRESAKSGVRPFFVVVLYPESNQVPRVMERVKPIGIEALVAKPAVEGFDEGVVDGLAGTAN